MNIRILISSAIIAALCSLPVIGEDIELYVTDLSASTGAKAKVLILFDNSGSMTELVTIKEDYDPNTIYPAIGSDNSLNDRFIYYRKGTGTDSSSIPVPDGPNEWRRFLWETNSCDEAVDILNTKGFYTGFVREYRFRGRRGQWREIPDNNGANIEVLDCLDDILNENSNNPGIDKNGADLPAGFPVDRQGSKQSPIYYTADVNDATNTFGTGEVVTLYTDNYLRWHHSISILPQTKSKLEIAQEAINQVILSTNAAEFGLAIFNRNTTSNNADKNGGRVIFGIQEMTPTAQISLLDTINELVGDTWTPLCETTYELYRYFAGDSVFYGDDDPSHSPNRDRTIEDSGNYISPFLGSCSSQLNIVIITDGEPTRDTHADSRIAALPGVSGVFDGNYLPALAGWMQDNDVNPNLDGEQTVNTYTIGFADAADSETAEPILIEAAKRGGGVYIPAKDPNELAGAFQVALTNILSETASFSSPSIATNNFDRTEHLDSVYYAMFLPSGGPRWLGNLKKLKIADGVVVDRNGNPAIGPDGNITDAAQSYWGTSTDGNKVNKGGVLEMLQGASDRTILSDLSGDSSLIELTLENAIARAGSEVELATYMSTSEAELANTLDWAKGIDVDDDNNDGSTTDIRLDIFADPLHSKPLVINYGKRNGNEADIRIVVGTNGGTVHMFNDKGATVEESWAFIPYELLPNLSVLRANTVNNKIYGMDGSPALYVDDINGDGTVDSAAGDKAWLVIGMRRGGGTYYAIDVSNPDSPRFMWKIDESTSGYEQLGQSWSKVQFGFIEKLGKEKPVAIFGGGYDNINNDGEGANPEDTIAQAVYIAEAQSGNYVDSFEPTGGSITVSGMTESIAGGIATLDSDFDGYIDRLYAADTGGDLWRFDIPDVSSTTWGGFKLATLGKLSSDLTDRRFYYKPSVVQTYLQETKEFTDANNQTVITRQEIPFDAILVGSGNRSHPRELDIQDMYFMVQDRNIVSQKFSEVPATIDVAELYDITSDPFGNLTSDTNKLAQELAYSGKQGWKLSFTTQGEKNISESRVLANVLYFTSFVPGEALTGIFSCEPQAGLGFLYAIDLVYGYSVYDWRKIEVGERVPDVPILYSNVNSDGDLEMHLVGVGAGDTGDGSVLVRKEVDRGLANCDANGCDKDKSLENVQLNFGRTFYTTKEEN